MSKLIRVDTNILLVLITGTVDENILHKHKRTKKYFPDDYYLIAHEIGDRRLVIFPNVATETHNLLNQHKDPERNALLSALQNVMLMSIENYVRSIDVALSDAYKHIGVTDTAILKIRAPKLLTDDFRLYQRALNDSQDVVNYTHLRVNAGIIPPL